MKIRERVSIACDAACHIRLELPKLMSVIAREDVCVYFTFLTFGPSQHKAKTLAVFFLQKHRLLLDYIVTSREETETELELTQH